MPRIWSALVFGAALMLQAQQQSPEPAAAVQANAQINKQLSDELTRSDKTKVMGDLAGAIKGYEAALAKVKSEPELNSREEEVLQRLSAAYIAAQRPKDAVRVSTRALSFHKEDCKPGSDRVEYCADAQYAL